MQGEVGEHTLQKHFLGQMIRCIVDCVTSQEEGKTDRKSMITNGHLVLDIFDHQKLQVA